MAIKKLRVIHIVVKTKKIRKDGNNSPLWHSLSCNNTPEMYNMASRDKMWINAYTFSVVKKIFLGLMHYVQNFQNFTIQKNSVTQFIAVKNMGVFLLFF